MRSKRQVINEILTQCVRDGDSDGFRMFNEMLDEVIREGRLTCPACLKSMTRGLSFSSTQRPRGRKEINNE